MADIEALYFEFLEGVAELEVFAAAVRHDNIRWRGQQREGGPIDLNSLEEESWRTYFRYKKSIKLFDNR